MVGVVLESSSTLYGKVPRLVRKTNRLTQAVVFFRRHFLCGALLCNCSSAEREDLSTHNSMFARLGTDYEIMNQWFFAILEAMATD